MANFTFTLPKAVAKKGMQHVGGRYNFKNGELTVPEDVARKIKPILVRFHGCSVSQEKATKAEAEDQVTAAQNEQDAVLSKTATKGTK